MTCVYCLIYYELLVCVTKLTDVEYVMLLWVRGSLPDMLVLPNIFTMLTSNRCFSQSFCSAMPWPLATDFVRRNCCYCAWRRRACHGVVVSWCTWRASVAGERSVHLYNCITMRNLEQWPERVFLTTRSHIAVASGWWCHYSAGRFWTKSEAFLVPCAWKAELWDRWLRILTKFSHRYARVFYVDEFGSQQHLTQKTLHW